MSIGTSGSLRTSENLAQSLSQHQTGAAPTSRTVRARRQPPPTTLHLQHPNRRDRFTRAAYSEHLARDVGGGKRGRVMGGSRATTRLAGPNPKPPNAVLASRLFILKRPPATLGACGRSLGRVTAASRPGGGGRPTLSMGFGNILGSPQSTPWCFGSAPRTPPHHCKYWNFWHRGAPLLRSAEGSVEAARATQRRGPGPIEKNPGLRGVYVWPRVTKVATCQTQPP